MEVIKRDFDDNVASFARAAVIAGERINIKLSTKTFEKLARTPGSVPELPTLKALGSLIGIDPEDFYEYPIARARADARADPASARRRAEDAARTAAARERRRREAGGVADRR